MHTLHDVYVLRLRQELKMIHVEKTSTYTIYEKIVIKELEIMASHSNLSTLS
jgi:hypothetical protein